MNERERLIRAASEEPDEDLPRLVLADWLEEDGETERATFIRSGVELAAMGEDDARYPEAVARYRRSAAFACDPREPWFDFIPKAALVAFHRGMLHRAIVGSAHEYMRQTSDAWRKAPVRELFLLNPEAGPKAAGYFAALATRPELARLTVLGMAGPAPAAALAGLLRGPHLAGLRSLFLSDHIGTGPYVDKVMERIDLPALEALCWREGDPAAWPVFVNGLRRPLRRLILSSYSEMELNEGADTWGWLLASSHWPTLRQLSAVHVIGEGGEGIEYVTAPMPGLPGTLSGHPMQDIRLSAWNLHGLASALSWGGLHTLRLDCGLTEALAPLASYSRAGNLARLFLEYPAPQVDQRPARPDALASGPRLANLRHLRIDAHRHAAEEMAGIAAGPYREGLTRLELGTHAGLSASHVRDLVARPWPRLRTLRLCLADGDAVAPLLTTRSLPELCTLSLTGRHEVDEAAVRELARAPGLPSLSLVANRGREWVIGGGEARLIDGRIGLMERDVFEDGPRV